MKKLFVMALALALCACMGFAARAEGPDTEGIIEKLEIGEMEGYYNPVVPEATDFRTLIGQLASGQLSLKGETLFSTVLNLLFYQLKSLFPLLVQIAAVTLLASLAAHMQSKSSTAEIIHFILYGVATALLAGSVISLMKSTQEALSGVSDIIELTIPPMTGLLLSIGSAASAGALQPNAALLSGALSGIVQQVVLPLVGLCLTLTLCAWLFGREKLGGIKNFFRTIANWTLGIMFTVFAAVTTLGGMAAAHYDGVSFRAVKYALNNGVPIVGGMVGESMNLLLASSYLVKNALGLGTTIAICFYLLTPLLNIGAYILLLRGAAAMLAPLEGNRIAGLLTDMADSLRLLLTAVFTTALAALVLMGAAIGAGNAVI